MISAEDSSVKSQVLNFKIAQTSRNLLIISFNIFRKKYVKSKEVSPKSLL